MFQVEIHGRVRRAVLVEGQSRRSVAREFGVSRKTIQKMLTYSVPPGYQRQLPAEVSVDDKNMRVGNRTMEPSMGCDGCRDENSKCHGCE
jgi:hypothetical protein